MTTVDESVLNDTPETAPAIPRTQRALDAAAIRDLRNGVIFKKMRADFRAACARDNAPCWLCNGQLGEIRYDLSYPHPLAFELDHKVTVKEAPQLLMDVNNFGASHHECNQSRGSDDPPLEIGEPSEVW